MARKHKPTAYERRLEKQRQLRDLKDRERIDIVVKASNGVITQAVAATSLNLTERHVRRLVKVYKDSGVEALLHQGRGKPSNHRGDASIREETLRLIRGPLAGSGPTLIADELRDLYDIELPAPTVRRWMIDEGLWEPRSPGRETHRRWRERKAHPGEMVQMDTSFHRWFGPDRDKSYCIALIDDATSRLYAKFYDADSTLTNMDALGGYMGMYGRPVSLYTDRAPHFTANLPKESMKESMYSGVIVTQIQRVLTELSINQILAYSPQAKGRIERLFRTFQDRLIQLMRHRDITNNEEANDFLEKKFISDWNEKYTKVPAMAEDLHRSLKGFDLASILSEQETRTVRNDYTFQHGKCIYQIEAGDVESTMRRAKITVEERLDGTLRARYGTKYLHFYLKKQID